MPTKAPAPRSTRLPSRTAGPESPARPRRAPASPRRSTTPPDRLCGGRSARSRRPQAPAPRSAAPELSPPSIPLTLPAMQSSYRHRRRSGRPAFALLSVLALLACACFPVAAQAETVYESEETTIPGETKPSHPKPKNNSADESSPAESSTAPGAVDNSGGTGIGSGVVSEADTGVATGKAEDRGQGNQAAGSQQNKAQPKKVADNEPLPGNAATAPADDDSGSSPLVPILIAVAVLAAISIGALVVRQRRQGRGPGQISPK